MMSRTRVGRRSSASLIAILGCSVPGTALADYYIDEVTDYSGTCLTTSNLNDITNSLATALLADSRSGYRYVNQSAWPQGFIESCNSVYGTGGLDSSYADANALAVFAGHGNSNPTTGPELLWGTPHLGVCKANLFGNIRLGQMGGGRAAYAIYGASCVMRVENIQSHILKQWLRQQLGFHNSPIIDNNQLGYFYQDTFSDPNKDAWLDEMEDRPGWFTGDNSPIVFSRGNSASEALTTHYSFRFAYGSEFWDPMVSQPVCTGGQVATTWYYTYINNGGC